MAKVEGRYAMEAWKFPALNAVANKKKNAILGFIALDIVVNRRVSHAAQANAKATRKK